MKTLKDLSRQEIKDIAIEYSNTDHLHARTCICEKYQITSSTLYNLLDKAVIEHMVGLNTIQNMQKKAEKNASIHAGDKAGIRSRTHYHKLLHDRNTFLFSKKTSKELTIAFANRESDMTKKEFCILHCIDIELLDKTLLLAILHHYIAKKVYQIIKARSFENAKKFPTCMLFFQQLDTLRASSEPKDIHQVYKQLLKLES